MGTCEDLQQALANLEEDLALQLVDAALAAGTEPLELLKACQDGMAEVGRRFEQEEYFVSDLMMSGEIFTAISERITPLLKAGGAASAGTVVMGTVKGDIHNIGKDIVVNMLKAANFEVIDLGVDVPPAKFVESLKATGARILGLSGLLTLAFDSMKETIDLVAAAGLRDQVRIMIGGGPVDGNVCRIVGADAWSNDAQKAVRFAQECLQSV